MNSALKSGWGGEEKRRGGGTKGIREGRNQRGKKYEKVYRMRDAERDEKKYAKYGEVEVVKGEKRDEDGR